MIGGEYLAPLALEDAQSIKQSSNVRLLSDRSTTNLLLTYNVDTGHPALPDVRVRRAIGMAMDREAIASGLFAGQAQPAVHVFPANVPYGPKPDSAPVDIARANSLLDEAGWTGADVRAKNGTQLVFRLILNPSSLPQAKSLSEVVQAQLKKVGITVEIVPLDSTAYSAAVAARTFDLRFYSTYGAPYDPYSMLTANFRTIQANHLFASPELDMQIPVALAATDEALLAIGAGALGDANGRLTWVDADLRVPGWELALGDRLFGAVVSSTALHWLGPSQLVAVYTRLARLVRPGGRFCNADHMAYDRELPTLAALAERASNELQAKVFISDGAPDWDGWWNSVLSVNVLADARAERDRRRTQRIPDDQDHIPMTGLATLRLHVTTLCEAGFAEVGTIWQEYDDRVLLAVR